MPGTQRPNKSLPDKPPPTGLGILSQFSAFLALLSSSMVLGISFQSSHSEQIHSCSVPAPHLLIDNEFLDLFLTHHTPPTLQQAKDIQSAIFIQPQSQSDG